MRRLLLFLVLVVACVAAVGYYRDWFKLSTASDGQSTNINVTVDKNKVKEDEERLVGKIRDQAGEISKKVHKGGDSKDQDDKPQ